MEDYLDWMATPHATIMAGEAGSIDLKPWMAGFTTELSYTLPTVEQLTLSMQGDVLHITASHDFKGIKFFEVSITDAEGTTMQRRLAVCSSDTSTAIRVVEKTSTPHSPVYNLNGQRIATGLLNHGVYIRNGKKVIIN